MSFFALKSHRTVSVVLFSIILATTHIYARSLPGHENLCAETTSVDSGATLRTIGSRAGVPDCYQVEMPTAGFLMVNAAVSASASANDSARATSYEARIGLLESSCTKNIAQALEPVRVVHQSTTHLLLHSDLSRTVSFCVGAQDPWQRLADYRLHTSFHAYQVGDVPGGPDRAEDPEEIELEPEGIRFAAGTKEEDPEEIELEPEGLRLCLPFTPMDHAEDPEEIELEPEGIRFAAGTKEEDPEEIELEPEGLNLCGPLFDHAEDPEEIELEPEGLVAGVLGSLCGGPHRDDQYGDDHGDTFLCGTPMALGDTAHGEISNAWGDDQDVFAFKLTETTTVRIDAKGSATAFAQTVLASLHDAGGQRLHVAGGINDESTRLVKTLRPGVYFVKLEGRSNSEGPYSVRVQALRWSW